MVYALTQTTRLTERIGLNRSNGKSRFNFFKACCLHLYDSKLAGKGTHILGVTLGFKTRPPAHRGGYHSPPHNRLQASQTSAK